MIQTPLSGSYVKESLLTMHHTGEELVSSLKFPIASWITLNMIIPEIAENVVTEC